MIENPVKWTDQIAHGFMGFFMSALSTIPLLGILNALWSLIEREYYQAKIRMIDVYRLQGIKRKPSFMAVIIRINFLKRDLVAGYVGIAVWLCIAIPLIMWVLKTGKVVLNF